jgi:hypothetical protein
MKQPTDLFPRPAVQVQPDDEPKIVRRGQGVNIQTGFAGTGMIPRIDQESILKFGIKPVKRLVEA